MAQRARECGSCIAYSRSAALLLETAFFEICFACLSSMLASLALQQKPRSRYKRHTHTFCVHRVKTRVRDDTRIRSRIRAHLSSLVVRLLSFTFSSSLLYVFHYDRPHNTFLALKAKPFSLTIFFPLNEHLIVIHVTQITLHKLVK